MSKVNKAIMHYIQEKHFTKDLLLGIESEVPGSLSNDIILDTLDDRVIVDDKLYKHILNIQLRQMKEELERTQRKMKSLSN